MRRAETVIRGFRCATIRTRNTLGKPIQEEVPGMQRDHKVKLLRPIFSIIPSECQSPRSHDSADKRLSALHANLIPPPQQANKNGPNSITVL